MKLLTKIKQIWIRLLKRLGLGKGIYYIGGAETLPPPLSAEEEAEILSEEEALTYAYYRNVIKGKTPQSAPSYQKGN